jgi:hypothetical protein
MSLKYDHEIYTTEVSSQFEGRTTQRPKEKGQTTIYKTVHLKLKIE